ncbi:MAG TPA: sterol desaturase family protein [Candidatus Binataceae bacterium]|nr:sterol desaturase family protein [Candidatus Binataceae bacterium]
MFSSDLVRLTAFVLVLIPVLLWETASPRRRRLYSRVIRWRGNLGILALNAATIWILVPSTAAGLAFFDAQHGWGLFNNLSMPAWGAIIASIIVLDFAIYLQHVLFHAIPPLWRVHRVHHTDLDFDATTGVRFHPIEILLSTGIKYGVISAIGAAPLGVLVFEVLLNATSMFNHGNMRIPLALDRGLRWIVVTPDMHRVHHSIRVDETNSNFGFNLPWWDHLFGTYRNQPASGHEAMTIGLEQSLDARELGFCRMLLHPFRSDQRWYATIRRRTA